jgi:hypothetical protein
MFLKLYYAHKHMLKATLTRSGIALNVKQSGNLQNLSRSLTYLNQCILDFIVYSLLPLVNFQN